MIHFMVPAPRAFGITDYLELEVPELRQRFSVLHFEDLGTLTALHRGTYVLAALDQVTPSMERLLTRFCEQAAAAEGIRILNHPARSLGRVELLRQLHARGYNEFRAVRAGEDLTRLRYPVFLRSERSHDGTLTPLLHSAREVEEAIGFALLQGNDFEDLVVIEFCATLDPDGHYRKYAAFRVGERILARGLNHGRDWSIKLENAEFTMPLVLEERDYVMQNPHAAELAEIFEIAGLEYGQIDYGIKQGRIQTWEINHNPTIGRGPGPPGIEPAPLRPIRAESREYFFDRFREAWAAVDLPAGGQAPIALRFDRRLVAAAKRDKFTSGPVRALLRRVLRPFKKILQPIAPPLLRALGRSRRWASEINL